MVAIAILDSMLSTIIHVLEWMGILVIAVTAVRSFWNYIMKSFDFSDDSIKIQLAKALAVGLEFKLAAEILKTAMVRTLDEVSMLAAIVILRVILTYVLHWEIASHAPDHRPHDQPIPSSQEVPGSSPLENTFPSKNKETSIPS